MTNYAQIIRDFIDFSQKNAELFTDEISASIADLLSSLSDDIEQISEAIFEWCEKYPQIDNGFTQLPLSNLPGERGPGGSKTEVTVEQIKTELNNRFPQRKSSSENKPPSQL